MLLRVHCSSDRSQSWRRDKCDCKDHLRSGEEDVGTDIESRTLTAGSVTVLPDSGVNFTLKLNDKLLTLNKGYRLQGFEIKSGDPGGSGGSNARAAAIDAQGGGHAFERHGY
jgi:hypothetical protein